MPRKKSVDTVQVEYNGYAFTRDNKTGYYLSAKPIYEGKRIHLHRYVYISNVNEIPTGYSIHHIDFNKDNNDISNLKLISNNKHCSMHSKIRIENNYDEEVKKFIERTNEKAKAWRKTERGKLWHSNHAQNSILKAAEKCIPSICVVCNTEYKTTKSTIHRAKFCSNKCKAKYRMDNKLDNVNKICCICGDEFSSSKYEGVKTCSKECRSELWKIPRPVGVSL